MITFTQVHVLLSLLAIFAGFVVAAGLVKGKQNNAWTPVFLWTTILTSVTGFFFPFNGFTPAFGFGIISLVVLAVTLFALYRGRLAGHWRWIYVSTALFAFYLNFFVLIVQSFLKIPALHALAPTQTEPLFAIAQGIALLGFVLLGFLSIKRFHPLVAVSASAGR